MKHVKSVIVIVLICTLMAAVCGCSKGNVSGMSVEPWEPSELYSEEEVQAAISEAARYFRDNFEGCTLTMMTYAGDETTRAHAEWAERHDADEAIVLTSSFDVDSSGGDGSLNPDSTYNGWIWIMVRDEGGSWEHADHGY